MVKYPKWWVVSPPNLTRWKHNIRNRRLPFIAFVIVTVILTSYVAFVYGPNSNRDLAYAASDEQAYAVDPALVAANTQFAFNLFRELLIEDSGQNIFISPLSISTALTMAYNGAGGTTKDAMAQTLKFGGMSLEEVNQEYFNLIGSLAHADQQVKLMIGNSIWVEDDFEPIINSSFIDRVTTSFNGELFPRDFGNPQTIQEMNGWIDQKTEGKIKDLIQSIDPLLVLLLVNAIYFKGDWVTQFDEAKTQKQDFFLSVGDPVKVDMMSTSGNFSYYAGTNVQVARLPYGRDKVAMYIFLPERGVPLDAFIADLNQTTHDEYISRLQPVGNLEVKLPKFKVEYGVKRLNSVLEKLGMGIAFDPNDADFNGIASNLYIGFVDHKAFVEVNEQGTEAAAATSTGFFATSGPPSFTVNRPFFFEIRDDRSGSILFMGKIINPT